MAIRITADTRPYQHKYTEHPKSKKDLIKILQKRILQDRDADLNDIDVSSIIDMSYLFELLPVGKIKIDKWDVSNVKNMNHMFFGCSKFDCDLSNWDVGKVENMNYMFKNCTDFKGKGLKNWKPMNLWEATDMFRGCSWIHNYPSWYTSMLAL